MTDLRIVASRDFGICHRARTLSSPGRVAKAKNSLTDGQDGEPSCQELSKSTLNGLQAVEGPLTLCRGEVRIGGGFPNRVPRKDEAFHELSQRLADRCL